MKFWLVVLFATLGSLAGSLLSYSLGRYGGNRFVIRYGKYFLLDKESLIKTEKWFARKGELTILIGRFIPLVRHVISIPAGIGKMDTKKFILYTLLGAGIWNAFLTYVGFLLGSHWKAIKQYADYVSLGVLIVLVVLIVYFVWRQMKKRRIRKNK